MPTKEDITKYIGEKFGRLTIIADAGIKHKKRHVTCECSCPLKTIKDIRLNDLKIGRTKSCGCLNDEKRLERNTTHGKRRHPIYHVWCDIKDRCYNKRKEQYKDWGGRGIKVCDEWKNNFQAFYEFCINNGWEKGLQIDRINNDGDYEPFNIRFVDQMINKQNQRLIKTNNTSGYRGVSYHQVTESYCAQINYQREQVYYKSGFPTAKSAAIARDTYCIKNNIPLPLNFPELKEQLNE